MMDMPDGFEYYTADTVAECFDYHKYLNEDEAQALYVTLWSVMTKAKNPTPLGGDGSNGTVELPEDRLDLDNDDKSGHWWSSLSAKEQEALAKAMADEENYDLGGE
jgi:hypothetical protein